MTCNRVNLVPLILLGFVASFGLLFAVVSLHPLAPPIEIPDIDLMLYNKQLTEEQKFSVETRRDCIKRAQGHDEITGEALKPGYQLHHIRPIQNGGLGTLDNCVVVNLSTHNALHRIMSNGLFDLTKYYPDLKIETLAIPALRLVAQFLMDKGWILREGYWINPWK